MLHSPNRNSSLRLTTEEKKYGFFSSSSCSTQHGCCCFPTRTMWIFDFGAWFESYLIKSPNLIDFFPNWLCELDPQIELGSSGAIRHIHKSSVVAMELEAGNPISLIRLFVLRGLNWTDFLNQFDGSDHIQSIIQIKPLQLGAVWLDSRRSYFSLAISRLMLKVCKTGPSKEAYRSYFEFCSCKSHIP